MESSSDREIIEIIPMNHQYHDLERSSSVHFSRIREATIKNEKISFVYLLEFTQDITQDERLVKILQTSLDLVYSGKREIVHIASNFPEIIPNINEFRLKMETNHENAEIYLNLTPLSLHFHSFFLRDGFHSKKYELRPYEIRDVRHDTFDCLIIPDFKNLDPDDWQIIDKLVKIENRPMTLKELLEENFRSNSETMVRFPDQSLRRKLNNLVEQGLMRIYDVGPKGEKQYILKNIELNYHI